MDYSTCPECGVKVDVSNCGEHEKRAIETGYAPKYALCIKCENGFGGGLVLSPIDRRPMLDELSDERIVERFEKLIRIHPRWWFEK